MHKLTPFLLHPACIIKVVSDDAIGVYILGDDKDGEFIPKYVGRSDVSLRNRLVNHNHLYDYTYFVFKRVANEKEAFYLESKWWHDCKDLGYDLSNRMHPDSPSGMSLSCPYCAFAKNACEMLRRAS